MNAIRTGIGRYNTKNNSVTQKIPKESSRMVSKNDEPSVDVLLAAIRDGDERAVETFIGRYEPMLRRVLRVTGVIRWLQSQVESQDLVQSVFIQVIANIQAGEVQFSDEVKLQAYLNTVGRSRLRDHIRRLKAAKRAHQRTVAGSPEALGQVAQATPSPSEIVDLREQVARVEDCTESADLKVLQERADGADWKELAAERNTTPDALRKRIERVRQRIRDNLAK